MVLAIKRHAEQLVWKELGLYVTPISPERDRGLLMLVLVHRRFPFSMNTRLQVSRRTFVHEILNNSDPSE